MDGRKIRGTFEEHSRNIQGTFNLPGICAVRTEHQEVSEHLLPDSVVEGVLSERAAAEGAGRYFDALYFSDINSENENRTHKKVLTFKFKIPTDPVDMAKCVPIPPLQAEKPVITKYVLQELTGRLYLLTSLK
eukprot:681351-Prorocentrum_minimum.AAC.2